MRMILCLMMLVCLAGCQVKPPDRNAGFPTTQWDLEISRNPAILATRKSDWAGMSLYGISFGQHESVIPEKLIRERINAGWIVTTNNNRYRSGNDNHIDALGVWQPELLGPLGMKTQADIERVFGKPESIAQISLSITVYYYEQAHIRVLWNEFEKRVSGVNVVK